MLGPDQVEMQELRTPSGWYLCLQLDDLLKVCEWFYLDSSVRYNRDFLPSELKLPFLLKDSPTEDRSVRILQTIRFEQAQQVVSYDPSLKPKGWFRWKKRPGDLPDWIWERPPWPHLDETGYRHVCLGNAFFCATKDDQPFIDQWIALVYKDCELSYAPEYHETAMPFLVKVTVSENGSSATVNAVPTADLMVLVRHWAHYLGARSLPWGEWKEFSHKICLFIDNLLNARWPINKERPPRLLVNRGSNDSRATAGEHSPEPLKQGLTGTPGRPTDEKLSVGILTDFTVCQFEEAAVRHLNTRPIVEKYPCFLDVYGTAFRDDAAAAITLHPAVADVQAPPHDADNAAALVAFEGRAAEGRIGGFLNPNAFPLALADHTVFDLSGARLRKVDAPAPGAPHGDAARGEKAAAVNIERTAAAFEFRVFYGDLAVLRGVEVVDIHRSLMPSFPEFGMFGHRDYAARVGMGVTVNHLCFLNLDHAALVCAECTR